jgi:SAM-dependent methyltransferase
VHDLYDARYFQLYPGGGSYDEDERPRRYEAAARLRFVRRFVHTGRLLEIGSAMGHFLAVARDAGFEVMGVEPSDDAARRARERYGVPVVTGFAEDVVLDPASVDSICAWHVIEHIPNPAVALRRLAQALRPGGLLALEVPNVQSRQARRLGARWPHLDLAHHVAHYGPQPMCRLLERSGLQPIHVETFPGTGYFPPSRLLQPATLAGYVKELATLRAVPRRAHPWKHELLRIVARMPEASP